MAYSRFMRALLILAALAATLAGIGSTTAAAQDLSFREMRWRDIGPTRAGRARALAGVASQPNTFYAGFDNGGVWRSTDYGANWVPLFDDQSTGSIGAIAVAPSNPNVIYVGTGAGIIRPDLAIGDGMYKSTDAGRTWQHLGLRDSQMIAAIAVDPGNADRLFVAVLGHPYGPNPERGVFRSTDGGRTFEKVLFKDDYTSANEVLIDPRNPNVLYATLWSQQQSFIEGQGFGERRDGDLQVDRRRDDLDAARARDFRRSCRRTSRSPRAIRTSSTPSIAPGQGPIGFYKSTDGGAHWFQAIRGPGAPAGLAQDMRPLARIGGGDLPTVTVDPKDPNVVYTASTVMWRTLDGGLTWSAVRGAPGGDDYQRIWINPNDTQIILAVADQGAVVSANRGRSWSNWYNQNTGGDVSRHHRQRVSLSRLLGTAGLGQRVRAEPIGRRAHHVPRLASGQHPGIRDGRAGSERTRTSSTAASAPACRATIGARPRPRRSDPTRRARCPAAAR